MTCRLLNNTGPARLRVQFNKWGRSRLILSSYSEEVIDGNAGLIDDGTQGAFRHVAGMVRNGGVAAGLGVEPDLM